MASIAATPEQNDKSANIDAERQISREDRGRCRRFLQALTVPDGDVYNGIVRGHGKWYARLLDAGVEENGVKPVPPELRNETAYNKLFTVFFASLLCILPLATGALGTTTFRLNLRDASVIIIFFALLTCIPPAFMGVGGYQTGMRQMIQARYSFGLYFVTIPILLNTATVTGFSLVGSIVSGQTIAAVNPGADISVDVGIGITCAVSFVTAMFGYRVIHFWQRWQWVPNLIALTIAIGCGGKQLVQQSAAEAATARQVISYGSLMAGYFITFGGTISDFTVYHMPGKPKREVFAYIFLGLWAPSIVLLILGAAIGGAIPNVPSWQSSWDARGAGGVMAEMLLPAGGFGKLVLVVLALSVVGNIATSMYSVALCLQMLLPIFIKVPRIVFIVVVVAIMVPMAIYAAAAWETSLENFLSIIGYWAGCFDAILIVELVAIRKMDFSTFDHRFWNVGSKLPTGLPAIGAAIVSLAVVVPGMDAAWYTGPIGKRIGDIGFEAAFFITAVAYFPLRSIEAKWRGCL